MKQNNKFFSLLRNQDFILAVYILFAIVASVTQYLKGKPGDQYTRYNNFMIFRESFHHLIQYLDLYAKFDTEHWDYYKYSPAFAVLMAPFSWLPDLPGLIIWNLINAGALFFAIKNLPIKNAEAKKYISWFVLLELLTSMQNSQSNGLIAALLVGGFNKLESKNYFIAALFLILSAFIKVFGIVACILFVFYPEKIKFILYSLCWAVVFICLPLIFISAEQLIFLYKSWLHLLTNDYDSSYGLSVMGWLYTWFHLENIKILILALGLIFLLIPLLKIKEYSSFSLRYNYFCALLIWLIIFNHKAESPSFIIAIMGVAAWYFNSPKTRVNTALIIIAFIFTSLSPTDMFPSYLRSHYVVPYVLKAIPCILIWIKINIDFIRYRKITI